MGIWRRGEESREEGGGRQEGRYLNKPIPLFERSSIEMVAFGT